MTGVIFTSLLKGLTMIFAGQEKPIYHFQKHGNMHISKQLTKFP